MPSRLCLEPRCPDLASYRGRCRRHSREQERDINRTGKDIYSTKRWQILRRRRLFIDPLCPCGKIATDVDHIVPLPKGKSYDLVNTQSLCKTCHSRKTRHEQKG